MDLKELPPIRTRLTMQYEFYKDKKCFMDTKLEVTIKSIRFRIHFVICQFHFYS